MGKYLCYCIHKKILSRKIIPKITRVRPSEQKLQGGNIFLKIYFNFLLAGERKSWITNFLLAGERENLG